MGLKYQDIEVMLREENVSPKLRKIIQFLHAENIGLKQEINGICQGLDRILESINAIATVAGIHKQLFEGLEQGKSVSETIAELRSEHLADIESEEIAGHG